MVVTTKVTAAVNILKHLRTLSAPISAPALATAMGMSPFYLSQIGHQMVTTGLIGSKKGPGGGYRSIHPEVSLLEVYHCFRLVNKVPRNPLEERVADALRTQYV